MLFFFLSLSTRYKLERDLSWAIARFGIKINTDFWTFCRLSERWLLFGAPFNKSPHIHVSGFVSKAKEWLVVLLLQFALVDLFSVSHTLLVKQITLWRLPQPPDKVDYDKHTKNSIAWIIKMPDGLTEKLPQSS